MVDPLGVAFTVLDGSVDARVRADRVGHITGSALVLVAVAGMERVIRSRLERVDYTAHCYGPNMPSSLALSMQVRAALLSEGVIHSVPGIVVSDASVTGPNYLPDEDTNEQRFILNFTLFYYETGEIN